MAPVQKKPQTVVELIDESGSFTILVDAIQTANLTSALKKAGPFTIFAPDNDAFQRLPKGTLKSLLKAQNRDELQNTLLYHLVEGQYSASDVASVSSLPTLNGAALQIQKKGNVLHVNEARIRETNMEAKNGIVHVIDRVLTPEREAA
jgi:uncharacterized surface protein with fasciclin (FAS1) repeats